MSPKIISNAKTENDIIIINIIIIIIIIMNSIIEVSTTSHPAVALPQITSPLAAARVSAPSINNLTISMLDNNYL